VVLYLDASVLVKLYTLENDAARVDFNVARADRLATSQFTYVEVRAALARAFRDKRLTRSGDVFTSTTYAGTIAAFARDWRSYIRASVSGSLIRTAGQLADKHTLRAGDALQLASAIYLRSRLLDVIELSVADNRLRSSAISEGFVVV
jgi:uncharacterized protein